MERKELTPAGALVFFGASGDLAHKQIFPALQKMIEHGNLNVPVIGVAKSGWNIDQIRDRVRDSLTQHGGINEAAFTKLIELLQYIDGDYQDPATFDQLRKALGGAKVPVHYLAIPPSMFGPVIEALGRSGCAQDGRVIVEKPFGRDLASAQKLNGILHEVFPSRRFSALTITWGRKRWRTLFFRFANTFFEPIWNCNR